MPHTVALIVAAGRGVRFGGPLPKQYRALAGQPILRRTAEALSSHPAVGAVRAVIAPGDTAHCGEALAGLDVLPPVEGGAERQDSVRRGLESLADLQPDRVLIHDGVRPLVDTATIDRVVAALDDHEGAIAALPVTDTLKRGADGETPKIAATVDRAGLWRAQTPQGFRFRAILDAHEAAGGRALTDDAAVAEAAGLDVALVLGDADNLKITTEADLAQAERLLAAASDVRIGQGFDVHRFGPGTAVMLCGVAVPHERGLMGHSDADVGLHAATDAVLGALGAGDIGSHFPPSDPQWAGAASDVFLAHARDLVRARGGAVLHLDVTLICEAPKVGPHRAAMTARLAEILELAPNRVSVKATTTEGLGFTGRGEGIAAQAVATVRLPAGN